MGVFYSRRYSISGRAAFLVLSDIVCIALALVLSSLLRFGLEGGVEYVLEHIPTLSGSCLIFLLVFYAGGMYEQQVISQKNYSMVLAMVTVVIAVVLIVLVFYARFNLHIGRGILLISALFIYLSVLGMRTLYRMGLGQGFFARHTLIVGDGEEVTKIIQLMQEQRHGYFKIFGVVATSNKIQGTFIESVPVLGSLEQLRDFVRAYSIETIILGTSLTKEMKILRELRPLRYAGVELLDYVSLNEEIAQYIPLDHIDDEWLMHAAMNSSRIHIRKLKRILDIIVASMGLVITLPLSLLCMILIPLDSKGPVFYRQKRLGLDAKVFHVLKFRTMTVDAEQGTGAVWAGKSDSRVTRIGSILRTSRIDEIPQLYNVLLGNMSLVGPRPERPEFVETLAVSIPFYMERLLVPPGITGWAQVKYPYAASIEASLNKLQYDLYYIKHMSLFLDVAILLKTFKTIVVGLRHSDGVAEEDPNDQPNIRVLPSESDDNDVQSA